MERLSKKKDYPCFQLLIKIRWIIERIHQIHFSETKKNIITNPTTIPSYELLLSYQLKA